VCVCVCVCVRYAVLKLLADPSAKHPADIVHRLRAMVENTAATPTDGPVDSTPSASRLSERELASAGMSIVTEVRQLLYTVRGSPPGASSRPLVAERASGPGGLTHSGGGNALAFKQPT
jgi:hypothetical protein